MEGGLQALAEAAQAPADALSTDEPDDDALTDVTRCDWCSLLKPSCEVTCKWVGAHDLWLCEDCRECGPEVDHKVNWLRGRYD